MYNILSKVCFLFAILTTIWFEIDNFFLKNYQVWLYKMKDIIIPILFWIGFTHFYMKDYEKRNERKNKTDENKDINKS